MRYFGVAEALKNMDGFFTPRRSFFEALFLGLVVTGACYLPPLQLATNLDGRLYDLWSQIAPPQPAADTLLVYLEDADSLEAVATLAHQRHAMLLITTAPQPPSVTITEDTLGPVEIPVGQSRLRRTDWTRGGHLWFRPDSDGVIRHDWPMIDEGEPTPSLAFYAATLLAQHDNGVAGHGSSTIAPGSVERRWLRFYAADAFPEVTAEQLTAQPDQVAGKVLIAGSALMSYRTPIGMLSAPQLLAHALTGYRQNQQIQGGLFGSMIVWSAAFLALAALMVMPFATAAGWWWFCGSSLLALALAAASAFTLASVWLPIAGAAFLLLTTGSIAALRAPRTATAKDPRASALRGARRAGASGHLEEAWRLYRHIPAAGPLLGELHELATRLDSAGLGAQATELYHRIAQIDSRFRDVGTRLARSHRPPTEPVAPPASRENMPKALGRYELLELIGHGAMGNVYLGRDPKINRIVAIKAIDLTAEFEPADLEAASRQFLREAETAGRLSHPNIVTIFDVGETDGLAYIAMEYLRGQHLSEFATANTLLPTPKVLDLLARTADALDYAHKQNVVHRDIKPANIMYDPISDGLKITDFGIARLIDASRTRTGIVLGTPAFMSPEQLEGKNVNGHTDLFALGVSLYQLLTGYLPFRGASMTKLMFVIANEPHQSVTAVRSELHASLNPIVDRALAKDPADRFQTGAEMAAALRFGAAQLS